MLSQRFFDRLISSHGLVFEAIPAERRVSGARVPHRRAVAMFNVSGGTIAEAFKGTVRDVSLSGVGVVVERDRRVTKDFLICFGGQLCTSAKSSVIQCATHRTTSAGPATSVVGAKFVAVLAPGQVLSPGLPLSTYTWLPVEADSISELDHELDA